MTEMFIERIKLEASCYANGTDLAAQEAQLDAAIAGEDYLTDEQSDWLDGQIAAAEAEDEMLLQEFELMLLEEEYMNITDQWYPPATPAACGEAASVLPNPLASVNGSWADVC